MTISEPYQCPPTIPDQQSRTTHDSSVSDEAASPAPQASQRPHLLPGQSDEPDFVGSDIQAVLREKTSDNRSIQVPAWCVSITRTSQQAIVLAQILYWFGLIAETANARHGRPRSSIRAVFGNGLTYHCAKLSHQTLARQCCLSVKTVRTAIQHLIEAGLIIMVRDTDAARIMIDRGSGCEVQIGTAVTCYRLNIGALYEALSDHVCSVTRIHRDRPSWRQVELAILRFALRHTPRDSQDRLNALLNSSVCQDYAPSSDDEFVGSRVAEVLQLVSPWVTVPHWVIQMVHGNTNDALVLTRIYQWHGSLRQIRGGVRWLQKTHCQLAEETGLLRHGDTRTRHARVSRSLASLERRALIEKRAPHSSRGGRFSHIRLLPEGLTRALNLIESGEGWHPTIGGNIDEEGCPL